LTARRGALSTTTSAPAPAPFPPSSRPGADHRTLRVAEDGPKAPIVIIAYPLTNRYPMTPVS
jgi:hypothetical protein